MNLVAENCTNAAIFSHGEIRACGSPKQLFSDYKLLEEQGLDLPVTAYVTKRLKDDGIDIDNDLTVNGFIDALAKEFFGGGR